MYLAETKRLSLRDLPTYCLFDLLSADRLRCTRKCAADAYVFNDRRETGGPNNAQRKSELIAVEFALGR